jgi:hypothetical protein
MLFIPSHPKGDDFLRFIGRPWIRFSIGPRVYPHYRSAVEDCIMLTGSMARPRDDGEVLLRFKITDGRLSVRAVVSKCLNGSELEFDLDRLTWYVEMTWAKSERRHGAN